MFEDIEIIDAYTRADAIRDGVLSDVTGVFARHRYLCPVAITAAILHLVESSKLNLNDVASTLYNTIQERILKKQDTDVLFIRVQDQELKCLAHGDDVGDLCLTIMLPSED